MERSRVLSMEFVLELDLTSQCYRYCGEVSLKLTAVHPRLFPRMVLMFSDLLPLTDLFTESSFLSWLGTERLQ